MNVLADDKAGAFYSKSLQILNKSKITFWVAGTYAINAYTGIARSTKDLDIFCKAGDYPKVLELFKKEGYKATVEDERWLAKVYKGRIYFDLIFNNQNGLSPITDDWLKQAPAATIYGIKVKLVPPTELILSKIFCQARAKYDGPDIVHLIITKSKDIDWKRLLKYMEQYWEVLLMQVLNFRFIYPSERERVPRWLLDELLNRLQSQMKAPTPRNKICRGRLLSVRDYLVDVKDWGFADVVGNAGEQQ